MPTPLYDRLAACAAVIAARTGRPRHDVAVVLGSGLGTYPERLAEALRIPYADLPGFPAPAAVGHAGMAYSAECGDNDVLLLAGRVHAYEGHDMDAVVFAVRTAVTAGAHTVVLTNAAGGCGPNLAPGDLVLIRDHLNLTGRSPLIGPNDDRLGPRFPDMTDVYSPELRHIALAASAEAGVLLREGVYAWFLGPAYETPAEVEMARRMGADLVGMSTVPEAIAARHLGARVLGLSLVTNLAAGRGAGRLDADEVIETAAASATALGAVLDNLLPRL